MKGVSPEKRTPELYVCRGCREIFPSTVELLRHKLTHHQQQAQQQQHPIQHLFQQSKRMDMDSMPIKKRKIEMIDISPEEKPGEKIIKISSEKMEEFSNQNGNGNGNGIESHHHDEKENEKERARDTISPGLLYDLDLHATVEKKISDPVITNQESKTQSSPNSESEFPPMPKATTIEPPSIPLNPVPTLRLIEERTTEKIYVCDQDYQNYNYNNYNNYNFTNNPNNSNPHQNPHPSNNHLHPFSVQRIIEREFHVEYPHLDQPTHPQPHPHFPPVTSHLHHHHLSYLTPNPTPAEPHFTSHNMTYENLSKSMYYQNYTEDIQTVSKNLDENFPPSENPTQFCPPHPYENPHQDLILWNPGLPDYHNQNSNSNQSTISEQEILKKSKNTSTNYEKSETKFVPIKSENLKSEENGSVSVTFTGSGKECPTCGKIIRSDMKRHMKIHTGLKPVTCTVCSRSFARRDHLSVHLKKVHGR